MSIDYFCTLLIIYIIIYNYVTVFQLVDFSPCFYFPLYKKNANCIVPVFFSTFLLAFLLLPSYQIYF